MGSIGLSVTEMLQSILQLGGAVTPGHAGQYYQRVLPAAQAFPPCHFHFYYSIGTIQIIREDAIAISSIAWPSLATSCNISHVLKYADSAAAALIGAFCFNGGAEAFQEGSSGGCVLLVKRNRHRRGDEVSDLSPRLVPWRVSSSWRSSFGPKTSPPSVPCIWRADSF